MGGAKGDFAGAQGVMASAYVDGEVQGLTGGAKRDKGAHNMPTKNCPFQSGRLRPLTSTR